MAQTYYRAKIRPQGHFSSIEVEVPANDHIQAKKIIEAQYGKVTYTVPVSRVR